MNLAPEKIQNYLDKLEKMQPLFDKYLDESMAQVSLRFCISHPACQTVIPGAKTEKQVIENSSASDLGAIPKEIIPTLD
jgi:myo-inositol catabolism protein IolS